MARGRFHPLLAYIHRLTSGPADAALSDRHLLERFAHQRDEDAFAALVRRHGSLVLSVCRRLLDHEQDAEDAFQAVFLVLARKAGSVRWRDDIGNWLYGVACRVARKARAQSRGRTARSEPLRDVAAPVAEEAGWMELRPVLDEEISRLPEKYRAAVVLCYLKGKTYNEAARLLGWAEGTVSGRLARARELLRRRLIRRGLTLSAALLTTLPPGSVEAALPATLTTAAVRTALAFVLAQGINEGVISGSAVALANEVLRSMLLAKWKIGVAVLLVLTATGTTAVVFAQRRRPEQQPQAAPIPAKAPAVPKADKAFWEALVAATHRFAEDGELDHLRAILDRYPELVRRKQTFHGVRKPYWSDGYTLLHRAVERGREDVVAYLIEKGADVNAVGPLDWTPLHVAAQKGDLAIVKRLVKAGARIGAKTAAVPEGRAGGAGAAPPGDPPPQVSPAIPSLTPLELAQEAKHLEVVAYLKAAK